MKGLRTIVVFFLLAAVLPGCSRSYLRDISGNPSFPDDQVEVVADLPMPPGNIAVSENGRIFFTFHPDVEPAVKVAEWIDGMVVPFPDQAFQSQRDEKPWFDTVLSLRIDRKGRLWTLDHGYFGIRRPRLLAFDINTGSLVHQHDFDSDIAGFGSFLNDFQVTADGKTIFIADTGAPVPVVGGEPALIVYDVESRTARRVLEDHASVQASDQTIRVNGEDFSLMGMSLKIAVDSIALDRSNRWLYYGAVNADALFRVPVQALLNETLVPEQLAAKVERFSSKTMSDGITTDAEGNIYLTDMEHSAIHRISTDRKLHTLLRNTRYRWPDGFSFGPEGRLYFTCSDLMNVVGKSADHIQANAPYQIFRFKPGAAGYPGH